MIIYNIRANGPWEYDKFILNTMQLYNEIKELEEDTVSTKLEDKIKKLDDMITKFTCDSSIMNKLILESLKGKGNTIGY